VGGWVHCRRPLARPPRTSDKKNPSADLNVAKTVFKLSSSASSTNLPTLGKDAAPHKILSNLRQGCCPSQIYPTLGKDAAPQNYIHLGRAGCPSTRERL
jgi:hypothetical protein